jgi:alkylation response protein AidB-like acyl-CoA dehydrogenase
MAVGIARAALEFAIDYSKQRVQFGRADRGCTRRSSS